MSELLITTYDRSEAVECFQVVEGRDFHQVQRVWRTVDLTFWRDPMRYPDIRGSIDIMPVYATRREANAELKRRLEKR